MAEIRYGEFSDWDIAGSTSFFSNMVLPTAIHEGLLANGWALAATQPVDPFDYDTPVLGQGVAKWKTYYKNDSLHGTLPIYLNFGFHQRYNSGQGYFGVSPWFQVGSRIDSNGTVLDPTGTNSYYNINRYNAVYNGAVSLSSGPSWAGFCINQTPGSAGWHQYVLIKWSTWLQVSRTVDSAGNPTAEGYFVYLPYYNLAINVGQVRGYFHAADPDASWTITDNSATLWQMALNLGVRTQSPAGEVHAYRLHAVTTEKTFVDDNSVLSLGVKWPVQMKATPNLVEHTFMPVGNYSLNHSYSSSSVDSTRFAMRWT